MQISIIKASEKDYQALTDIWERSVQATHDFLQRQDFEEIKQNLPSLYLPNVDAYIITIDNIYAGFIGLAGGMIEMLFIDTKYRNTGLGSELIAFALKNGVSKVDVNEQNRQALNFYLSKGFKIISRVFS